MIINNDFVFKFTDIATDTTSNFIHFSFKVKDKIINVFNDKPSVPNKEMVNDDVPNMEILNGNVAETYITSKTISSQDLETDIGQVIPPSQDSKTIITTVKDNGQVIIPTDSKNSIHD